MAMAMTRAAVVALWLMAAAVGGGRAEYGGLQGAAKATWYGDDNGPGTDGGACGFGALEQTPYGKLVAAGSAPLYRAGAGCGACYRIRCVNQALCANRTLVVPITDECPGGDMCGGGRTHFDLSGAAFGALALPGREDDLRRKVGVLDILYERWPCSFDPSIFVKIRPGSSPWWYSVIPGGGNGPGAISEVSLKQGNSNIFLPFRRDWGGAFVIESGSGLTFPFTLRLKSDATGEVITCPNLIQPSNAGTTFNCGAQFSSGNESPPPPLAVSTPPAYPPPPSPPPPRQSPPPLRPSPPPLPPPPPSTGPPPAFPSPPAPTFTSSPSSPPRSPPSPSPTFTSSPSSPPRSPPSPSPTFTSSSPPPPLPPSPRLNSPPLPPPPSPSPPAPRVSVSSPPPSPPPPKLTMRGPPPPSPKYASPPPPFISRRPPPTSAKPPPITSRPPPPVTTSSPIVITQALEGSWSTSAGQVFSYKVTMLNSGSATLRALTIRVQNFRPVLYYNLQPLGGDLYTLPSWALPLPSGSSYSQFGYQNLDGAATFTVESFSS